MLLNRHKGHIMEKQILDENITEEQIKNTIICIHANILINLFVKEDIIFGQLDPNKKIPINDYIRKINFPNNPYFANEKFLNSSLIENGYVINKDLDSLCLTVYRDRVDCLFEKFPVAKIYEDCDNDTEDIFHYKYGMFEYLKSIYPLFKEIIDTEVETDFFIAVPDISYKKTEQEYRLKVEKFILAIKLRGLRQGRRIDRYVKSLPYISPFVRRLIRKYKGHFYLKNNDINSLDFKFALFSCFRFINSYNEKLFELKTLKWEELHRLDRG